MVDVSWKLTFMVGVILDDHAISTYLIFSGKIWTVSQCGESNNDRFPFHNSDLLVGIPMKWSDTFNESGSMTTTKGWEES